MRQERRSCGHCRQAIARAAALSAFAAALTVPHSACANQVYTSTDSTGNWSTPSSWTSDTEPVSSIDTELDFGGSGSSSATFTDDIGSGTFTLNEIQLDSTASVAETIAGNTSGNTLTFANNSQTTGPEILQNGSGMYVIKNGILLNNSLTIGGSGSGGLSLTGTISGSSGLIIDGLSTVMLGGTNTYTGATNIESGILSISSIGIEGSGTTGSTASGIGQSNNAATNLVLNGGTLQYTGAATSTDRLFTLGTSGGTIDASGTGTLTFNNGGSIAFSVANLQSSLTLTGTNTGLNTLDLILPNDGTGVVSLIKNGAGTWLLGSQNSFTGNVTVNAGILEAGVSNTAATPTSGALGNPSTAGRTITVNNGGELLFFASNVFGASTSTTPAVGIIINSGGLVTESSGMSNILGSVTLNGGTLTGNAASSSSYQAFYLAGGLVKVGGSSASSITTSGSSNNGIHLATTTIFNVADVTGDSRTDLTISAPLLNQPNNSASSLTKTGAGTMLLSGADSYSGTTTIDGGTIDLNSATGSLNQNSTLTFTGSGTFLYENTGATAKTTQYLGTITFSGGDDSVEVSYTSANQTIVFEPDHFVRSAGATGNIISNGGTNGSTTDIAPPEQAGKFINQGTFFDGSNYAWTDPMTGWIRSINYIGDNSSGAYTLSGGTSGIPSTDNQVPVVYVQVTGPLSGQGAATFTTLNLTSNSTFALNNGATLTVNGILKSGNIAGGATISGGSGIQAASGVELVIRTDQANDSLTINSSVLADGSNPVTKSGLGTLTFGGSNTYAGTTTVNAGVLDFSSAGTSTGGGSLEVGGTAGTAVVNIASSGVVTFNGADVGGVTGSASSPGAAGAINQSSGTFNYSTAAASYLELGTGVLSSGSLGGYGAYSLSGGTLTSNGYAAGIRVGSVGIGSFTQSGGSLILGRELSIGTYGTGVVTLTGGTTTGSTGYGLLIGEVAGIGTLNIGTQASGSASLISQSSTGVELAVGSSATGTLNLNSGTLTLNAGSLHKGSGASAIINFNGGTLQAAASGLTLIDATPSAVNILAGGATIDTQGFTDTISAPLLGSSGDGFYPAGGSLSVSSGGTGYVGSPLVTATGGSGSGMTAMANISNGVITGLSLTNPGQNYQVGDVLNFAFAGGGPSTTAPTFNYTLQVSDISLDSVGGLTKLGTGTLVLTSTSTYTGATNILNGTLEIDGALGNTPVNVSSNGTLAGKGVVGNSGTNTVAVNGALAPGNSTTDATLTTGPMSWNGGGNYDWKVSAAPTGSPSNGAGTNWDNISFSTLSIGATSSSPFTITPIGSPTGLVSGQTYTWQIAQLTSNNAGAITGFTQSSFVLNAGEFAGGKVPASDFSLSSDGDSIDLTVYYAPVPEPSSGTLLVCASLIVLLTRRRPRAAIAAA